MGSSFVQGRRKPSSRRLIVRSCVEPSPQNPYAPPSSVVADSEPKAVISPGGRLYTPGQIRAGSFLGGPIVAAYFLRENFRILGRSSEARTTVMWGAALVVGLMALVPFLPTRFPNYLVPILYATAAGSVADKWQLKKQAIIDSGTYQVQSNWRVFGMSILLMLAFLVIMVLEIFGLAALGLTDF